MKVKRAFCLPAAMLAISGILAAPSAASARHPRTANPVSTGYATSLSALGAAGAFPGAPNFLAPLINRAQGRPMLPPGRQFHRNTPRWLHHLEKTGQTPSPLLGAGSLRERRELRRADRRNNPPHGFSDRYFRATPPPTPSRNGGNGTANVGGWTATTGGPVADPTTARRYGFR